MQLHEKGPNGKRPFGPCVNLENTDFLTMAAAGRRTATTTA